MTKKQLAAKRAENWKQALREHRVVRFPELGQLTSYPTQEAAQDAAHDANDQGIAASIVTDYKG